MTRMLGWSLIRFPEDWSIPSSCFPALSYFFKNFFFRTGDLLLEPVLPDNTPNLHTFVNEESRSYFEDQEVWPTGSFTSSISHFSDVAQVREAVAEWVGPHAVFLSSFRFCGLKPISFKISGKDLLPVNDAPSLKGK